MNADLFYYTETNRRPWAEQVARGAATVRVEVPADATLPQIIEAGLAAGMSQGTQRSGCFEVQTDAGTYGHRNPEFRERGFGKLDPNNAHFTPWD